MINDRIFHFVYGRIYFTVSDGFEDVFLSYCRLNSIGLYDVVKTENGFKGFIRYRDLNALTEAAKKSAMALKIEKRHGLPYLFYRYKRRFGIPAGVLMFAVIIRVLSLMVWSVEISGNSNISTEEIVECLAQSGVCAGVFTDSIQKNDTESVLYSTFEELLWVKVYVTGCRVFVDVREREVLIDGDDYCSYSNIVAKKDGEIIRADIFCGEGKIYPGTAVVKGDMLVNGVVSYRDGGVKFVNSDAVILARTKNKLSVSAGLNITAYDADDYNKRKSLYFFGMTVPLGGKVKGDYFTIGRRYFESADIVFPIGIYTDYCLSLNQKQIELTPAKASLIAFYDFSVLSARLYSSAQILERNISLNISSQVSIDAAYLCIEDIALEKSFTVNDGDVVEKTKPD